jgi:hypothetical protein
MTTGMKNGGAVDVNNFGPCGTLSTQFEVTGRDRSQSLNWWRLTQQLI